MLISSSIDYEGNCYYLNLYFPKGRSSCILLSLCLPPGIKTNSINICLAINFLKSLINKIYCKLYNGRKKIVYFILFSHFNWKI